MNYVKEYKGHKVPEGAKYYQEEGSGFMEAFFKTVDGQLMYSLPEDGLMWEVYNSRMSAHAIELPEDPQEWSGEGLPPIGCKCEVDTAESAGLSNRELEINGEEVTVIANVKNKHGYEITVFEAIDGGVFCFSSKLFRPLKTQQEKDREAFISAARKATNVDVNDVVATDIFDDMYHAGFTAPKADDNDQE